MDRPKQRPLGETRQRWESEIRFQDRMRRKELIEAAPTHTEEHEGRTFVVRQLSPPGSSR